jgi:hypothetical protein
LPRRFYCCEALPIFKPCAALLAPTITLPLPSSALAVLWTFSDASHGWVEYAGPAFTMQVEAGATPGADDSSLHLFDLDLHRINAGANPHPWWEQTPLYRLYLSTPRNSWTSATQIVDISDAERRNWYGPDHILRRLAHLYDDGVAQWLAEAISGNNPQQQNFAELTGRWLNLVWRDAAIAPSSPIAAGLPTLHHFEDFGIVSARSNWSGDEALVVLKTGPGQGHPLLHSDPPVYLGMGKAHWDANHMALYANGEWLVAEDPTV